MNLRDVKEGEEYLIKQIMTDDEELESFLFSLGCYEGEPITVISHGKGGCVVSIKDGRYSIDNDLAEAILVQRINRKKSKWKHCFFYGKRLVQPNKDDDK